MTSERRSMLIRWVVADSLGIFAIDFLTLSLATRSLNLGGQLPAFLIQTLPILALSVFLLWFKGLYSLQAKYLGSADLSRLFGVCLVSAVVSGFLHFEFMDRMPEPLFAPVLYGLILTPTLVGVRLLHRRFENPVSDRTTKGPQHREIRTLLLGGGDAGEMVVREVQRMEKPVLRIVGIIDDDPRKSYTRVRGVPIVGTTKEINTIVKKLEADEILIAVPSATGERMRHLTSLCLQTGSKVRTIPGVQDLIAGRMVSNQIREVDVSDLLRRPTVPPDLSIAGPLVRGRVILITGAGGSIGGELARQVARLSPSRLVLLGKGENSIFEVEQQIILDGLPAPDAVIADVRDSERINHVFAKYKPDVVFHAAAHKHVPLMQSNVIEAVRNNIFGTLSVLEAALQHSTSNLIFISTDKAVNPSNIMGATKRVSEQLVRAWSANARLRSSTVRFGNVLDSRGSLLPMLKMQIRRGGPVRVTHPEMRRFFMTIPEAVQLIIHAGAMGSAGETYILDMGEPLRIVDLAKDLIRLSGFEPDETMQIVFTGVRPGEKLEEELSYSFEDLIPTTHSKIRVADCPDLVDQDELTSELDILRRLCERGDEGEVEKALMLLARTERTRSHALVGVDGKSEIADAFGPI